MDEETLYLHEYQHTDGTVYEFADVYARTNFQPKTMSSSVTVDGVTKTTVESAIGGLADLANSLGLTVVNGKVCQTYYREVE